LAAARTSNKGEISAAIGDAMIIEYDFGKKERSAGKRFAKPAADASAGVKLVSNAQVHLELANARIAKLEVALRNAQAAASGGKDQLGREKILVDAAEYARLLRCKEIVAAALSDT
jgi:hypothetical protein